MPYLIWLCDSTATCISLYHMNLASWVLKKKLTVDKFLIKNSVPQSACTGRKGNTRVENEDLRRMTRQPHPEPNNSLVACDGALMAVAS